MKAYPLTCAPNEDSNQLAHPSSLIRVFVFRIKTFSSLAIQNAPSEGFDQTARKAQSDLNPHLAHICEGIFFDVETHSLVFTPGTAFCVVNRVIFSAGAGSEVAGVGEGVQSIPSLTQNFHFHEEFWINLINLGTLFLKLLYYL